MEVYGVEERPRSDDMGVSDGEMSEETALAIFLACLSCYTDRDLDAMPFARWQILAESVDAHRQRMADRIARLEAELEASRRCVETSRLRVKVSRRNLGSVLSSGTSTPVLCDQCIARPLGSLPLPHPNRHPAFCGACQQPLLTGPAPFRRRHMDVAQAAVVEAQQGVPYAEQGFEDAEEALRQAQNQLAELERTWEAIAYLHAPRQVANGLRVAEKEVAGATAGLSAVLSQARRHGIDADGVHEYMVTPEGFHRLECVCCLSSASSHALVGCGHRCLCAQCAGDIMQLPEPDRKCPICRAPCSSTCSSTLQVYL